MLEWVGLEAGLLPTLRCDWWVYVHLDGLMMAVLLRLAGVLINHSSVQVADSAHPGIRLFHSF